MFSFFSKKSVRYSLVGFAVVLIGYFAFGRGDVVPEEPVKVRRGSLTQEVNVTGRVKSVSDVSLAFERGGKIGVVSQEVGAKISAGEILAELSAGDLYAQLTQAQAGYDAAQAQVSQYRGALTVAQAKLSQARRGPRAEDLAVTQTQLDNAQRSFDIALKNVDVVAEKAKNDLASLYTDILSILNDGYIKAADAIGAKMIGIVDEKPGQVYNGEYIFRISLDCHGESDAKIRSLRLDADTSLRAFRDKLYATTSTNTDDLEKALQDATAPLQKAQDYVRFTEQVLNDRCVTGGPSAYPTQRANVTLASTNINNAFSAVAAKQDALRSQKIVNENAILASKKSYADAKNTLESAKRSLELKKAGADPDDITALEAQVGQAQANIDAQEAQVLSSSANVQNAQAQIEKSIIRSPINGILTKNDAKVGQIAAANSPLISVISVADYDIEVNVPEVNVGYLKVGNPVKITLDALAGETFTGKVSAIDPAETIVDGVVNFKVTIAFDQNDERFKSGLTANLSIEVLKKENVLIVPSYAIVENDSGTFVRVLDPAAGKDATKDLPVKLGIRSLSGDTEVISGVTEGMTLVNIGIKK